MTRDEHLSWCKTRALQVLDSGDVAGAMASMMSDLGKWDRPLYQPPMLSVLMMDAMKFRQTPAQMRDWIEGFN